MGRYVFTHDWELEEARLRLLGEIFDPPTTDRLRRLGVGTGWRCLEVGAGAGSLAAWLAAQVGPDGRVVATDVDTGFLENEAIPGVEVRRHDIVADDLEEGAFDLVHSRLVLEHLTERDLALKRMVAALVPGGVLVIEDFDWCAAVAPPGPGADLYANFMAAAREFLAGQGYDPYYGRRLAAELRNLGLDDVGADGRVTVCLPGSPETVWWQQSMARVHGSLRSGGLLTDLEVERIASQLADPGFCFQYPALMTAWGRRPA